MCNLTFSAMLGSMNVHFICRGNVLRSLIAETYVKSLNLKGVNVLSSGTNVDWSDETEREYFFNTLELLDKHGIKSYAKSFAEQLTQERADNKDITICMNQRVVDEAAKLVVFPGKVMNWNIIDIGEGTRIVKGNRLSYEEEIYKEITDGIDELVARGVFKVSE
jgi:protein-tyrosine-phosphatase